MFTKTLQRTELPCTPHPVSPLMPHIAITQSPKPGGQRGAITVSKAPGSLCFQECPLPVPGPRQDTAVHSVTTSPQTHLVWDCFLDFRDLDRVGLVSYRSLLSWGSLRCCSRWGPSYRFREVPSSLLPVRGPRSPCDLSLVINDVFTDSDRGHS